MSPSTVRSKSSAAALPPSGFLITVRDTGSPPPSSKVLVTVQTVFCVIVKSSSSIVGHPTPAIPEKK